MHASVSFSPSVSVLFLLNLRLQPAVRSSLLLLLHIHVHFRNVRDAICVTSGQGMVQHCSNTDRRDQLVRELCKVKIRFQSRVAYHSHG